MSDIKRYEFVYTNDFGDEYPAYERLEVDGEYVRFDDFTAAQAGRAQQQEELVKLLSHIAKVYESSLSNFTIAKINAAIIASESEARK